MADLVSFNYGGEERMSSLEVSELVEKRHDNVKRTIESLVNRHVIELPQSEEIRTATKPTHVYMLNKRSSLIVVAQLSPEFTARVVDRWQELESKNKIALPNFADPAAAAIAWAEQYTRATIAEQTKAQIGHKREATAMNTASQAVKKVNRLEGMLDHLKEYVSVKRMQMIFHGQKFSWRELKSASALMELPPIDVFDQNYGSVKAYHVDVWREVYSVDTDGNTCHASDSNTIDDHVN